MLTRVFYPLWSMECCGEPFAVGDSVQWGAFEYESEELGLVEGAGVDWLEEHHEGEDANLTSIAGRVTHMRAIRQEYRLSGDGRYLAPVSGAVSGLDLELADGTGIPSDPAFPDFDFTGYVVTLE